MVTWLAEDGEWDEARAGAPGNVDPFAVGVWQELTLEEKRVRMMRDRKWSRKYLEEVINDVGGDIDDLRQPNDDAFDDIMRKGPPEWFQNAVERAQDGGATGEGAMESAIAAGAAAVASRVE